MKCLALPSALLCPKLSYVSFDKKSSTSKKIKQENYDSAQKQLEQFVNNWVLLASLAPRSSSLTDGIATHSFTR